MPTEQHNANCRSFCTLFAFQARIRAAFHEAELPGGQWRSGESVWFDICFKQLEYMWTLRVVDQWATELWLDLSGRLV